MVARSSEDRSAPQNIHDTRCFSQNLCWDQTKSNTKNFTTIYDRKEPSNACRCLSETQPDMQFNRRNQGPSRFEKFMGEWACWKLKSAKQFGAIQLIFIESVPYERLTGLQACMADEKVARVNTSVSRNLTSYVAWVARSKQPKAEYPMHDWDVFCCFVLLDWSFKQTAIFGKTQQCGCRPDCNRQSLWAIWASDNENEVSIVISSCGQGTCQNYRVESLTCSTGHSTSLSIFRLQTIQIRAKVAKFLTKSKPNWQSTKGVNNYPVNPTKDFFNQNRCPSLELVVCSVSLPWSSLAQACAGLR